MDRVCPFRFFNSRAGDPDKSGIETGFPQVLPCENRYFHNAFCKAARYAVNAMTEVMYRKRTWASPPYAPDLSSKRSGA